MDLNLQLAIRDCAALVAVIVWADAVAVAAASFCGAARDALAKYSKQRLPLQVPEFSVKTLHISHIRRSAPECISGSCKVNLFKVLPGELFLRKASKQG